MKCLILGADGFLGSHLACQLLNVGFEVRAFDRFRDNKTNNLDDIKGKIELVSGNFLNREDLIRATDKVDWVFHFISTTTPASSSKDPIFDVTSNIVGTINLLDICKQNQVKKIIFASSGGTIYGDQDKEKYNEIDPTLPISPYGISKLTIERYLQYYKINYGLDYLILRYSNPYGLSQNKAGTQGVIPIFLNKIKIEEPIMIYGDGENVRDYIFVEDLVALTIQLLNKENKKFQTYNVGSGQGVSLNQLISNIESVTGRKFNITREPARAFDVRRVVLDNDRLITEIGSFEFTPLNKGIEKLWQVMQ
ncbi:MAG: NAD-dependent epimerase/dehydratase family protein [Bacteroidales bacterium]|nr:NAD-dependent epimerase/dehydratase family protein [Bacteroidales bacterium]